MFCRLQQGVVADILCRPVLGGLMRCVDNFPGKPNQRGPSARTSERYRELGLLSDYSCLITLSHFFPLDVSFAFCFLRLRK